jgi:F0F1-type ATP synthase alpha subunit
MEVGVQGLIIISFSVILGYFVYITYYNSNLESVKSKIDNREYTVQTKIDSQEAADLIAVIRQKLILLVDHLIKSYGGDSRTELLKQKQYVPMPAEEQVIVIFAGVKGYLDKMMTSEISKFERLFMETIKSKYRHLLDTIRKEGSISPKTESELRAILEEFIPSSGLQLKDK